MMLPFKEKKRDEGQKIWLTTFSDLMTLLLVFFVLLFSLSAVNVEKFQEFISSFQGIGILDSGDKPLENNMQSDFDLPVNNLEKIQELNEKVQTLEEIHATVQEFITQNNLESDLTAHYTDRGITLEINNRILFASAQAQLKPEALQLLEEIAVFFNGIPYTISVEGHTDNRSINNSKFPSNWELSTARAVAVVRFFSDQMELDPKKFRAVGYGEYHPVVPNNSQENMARNRRVVIVINSQNPYVEEGVE